jgi:hypothetical protein
LKLIHAVNFAIFSKFACSRMWLVEPPDWQGRAGKDIGIDEPTSPKRPRQRLNRRCKAAPTEMKNATAPFLGL